MALTGSIRMSVLDFWPQDSLTLCLVMSRWLACVAQSGSNTGRCAAPKPKIITLLPQWCMVHKCVQLDLYTSKAVSFNLPNARYASCSHPWPSGLFTKLLHQLANHTHARTCTRAHTHTHTHTHTHYTTTTQCKLQCVCPFRKCSRTKGFSVAHSQYYIIRSLYTVTL